MDSILVALVVVLAASGSLERGAPPGPPAPFAPWRKCCFGQHNGYGGCHDNPPGHECQYGAAHCERSDCIGAVRCQCWTCPNHDCASCPRSTDAPCGSPFPTRTPFSLSLAAVCILPFSGACTYPVTALHACGGMMATPAPHRRSMGHGIRDIQKIR